MTDIDEDCYANLLYHAAEEQLLRRQQLEQFIAKHSPTIPRLVLHTLASDELPELIHLGELEEFAQVVSDVLTSGSIDLIRIPYHNDILFDQFFENSCEEILKQTPDSSERWKPYCEMPQPVRCLAKIYPDLNPFPEFSLHANFFTRYWLFPRFGRTVFRIRSLMTMGGCRPDKLSRLCAILHANTVLPPENGYTRNFQCGETVTLEELREELMKRNASSQPSESPPYEKVNTVAISYRHFAHGSKQKLSDRDLRAIHRFLVASEASNVRFWIDSKLPLSNDGTFERWLTRGVRPYARYFTLVCPSAYEENNRYWIQMEKVIAMAARGIFFTTEDGGIYFNKQVFSYRPLCHRMLTMMVGIDGLPPGLRKQDEGKVIQWALGFLGDRDSVRLFRVRGPRLDGLCNMEFSENVVMKNITLLIKENGPLALPVETGRSWNEDNPLILKGIPDQILILPTWIGFWNPVNPRNVLFLNGTTLPQVIYGGLVGLEVTLRENFVKGRKNEVVRKVLRDIPFSELLQTTLLSFSISEKGLETTTSPNADHRVETSHELDGLPLETITNQYGLAPELKCFIDSILFVEAQNANDEVQDELSETSSEETDWEKDSGEMSMEEDVYETTEISISPLLDLLESMIPRPSSEEARPLTKERDLFSRFWNEGTGIVMKRKFQPKMKGMEAVTFPWECEWI